MKSDREIANALHPTTQKLLRTARRKMNGKKLAALMKVRRAQGYAKIAAMCEYISMFRESDCIAALVPLFEHEPHDVFWPFFVMVWPMYYSDFHWNERLYVAMQRVGAHASIKRLPAVMTVYRGCSRSRIAGISWTTNTLRWDSVDFNHGRLHVNRVKDGSPSVHPISGRELRALRRLQREQEPKSPFAFTSMRGAPFTTAGFRKMVARLGDAAGFDYVVHPHMLRHGCGYKLANDGVDTRSLQAYLGHKNIQHTVRYTELAPTRFKDFWRD